MPGFDMFKPLFPRRSRTSDLNVDRFWGKDKGQPTHPIGGVLALGAAALFVAAFTTVVLIVESLPHIFSSLQAGVQNELAAGGICGLAALLVGRILFEFRRRLRGVYAIAELGFAFATASVALSKLNREGDLAVWFGFAAAAYLVVRGLDNIEVAKQERDWPWSLSASKDPALPAGRLQ
jgi:hypothetical protein